MPEDNPNNRLNKAAMGPCVDEDQGAALPSKATLEDIRKLLKRYTKEVNSSVELSQSSKAMYIDFATCFVRWIYGGFQPGSRGNSPRRRKTRA